MGENAHFSVQDPEERLWRELFPVLQISALEAQTNGHSWRTPAFLVGASGLALSPQGNRIMHGSNFKPQPGGEGPRVCAEEEVMAYAVLKGCIHLIGIVVAAPYQEDDHTGEGLDGTLAPCVHCRRKFAKSIHDGDIVTPRTRFVSMRVESEGTVLKVVETTIEDILNRFPI